MNRMAVDALSPGDRPRPLVDRVLRIGLPFDLAHSAARAHALTCNEALASLGPGDSLDHVRILASQVVAMTQSHDEEADGCAGAAMAMADRLDDELAQGYALVARSMADPMPEHTDARLAAGRRVLDIAARHRESTLVPVGYLILLLALLEKGEIRTLDMELTGRSETAGRFLDSHRRQPVAWFRCLRAILDGDTDTAERLVEEQFAASRSREDSDALAIYTSQLGIIRWMQGRVDGAEDSFVTARREHPEQVLWAASLAWLWLRQGRRAAAEALFDSLRALEEIPRDRYWLSTITVLAETAAHLGSREFAEEVRDLLLPFAARLVPVGVGVAFWGTAARSLGLLEERLGLLAEARAHLEQAVALAGRVGAQAWQAEAQIELAEFALRHSIGDIPAYELLAEARATSVARGFEGLRLRTVQRPRIQVMGRFEVISHDGTPAEWTSRKARELLKMLVAARGAAVSREVYMEVLWPSVDPDKLSNRFSVAINAIRRALDPQRSQPRQHHLVVDGDAVRLDLANVDVDLERFLALARQPDEASRRRAAELYQEGAFTDEPYADWAVPIREHTHQVWCSLG